MSILNRAPVAPVRLNPDVPAELERIINRALEKDRNLRYQNASDMRAELSRLKRDMDSSQNSVVVAADDKTQRRRLLLQPGHPYEKSSRVVQGVTPIGQISRIGHVLPRGK